MKGVQGLMIAAALGIVGAACNWFYVMKQAGNYQRIEFVAVSPAAQINVGDVFRPDHFVPVPVPQMYVGSLQQAGVLWDDLETVVNDRAKRSYAGGEILLRHDLVAQPRKDVEDLLADDEVAFPVVVDARVFVSENFNPGDTVSFFLPKAAVGGEPTPVDSPGFAANPEQFIGPFRILRIGSRAGTREVERAYGQRSSREDVITVSLKVRDGQFDEKSRQLLSLGNRGVYVIKHPSVKQ